MPYKYIALVVAFYFISLMQNSFLSHFAILGVTPNLLLVLVCLFTFLDDAQSYMGIVSAVAVGAFLDLLAGSFFGSSIIAMLFVYFFIRKVLVYLIDFPKEYSILYFIPILTLCTIFYGFIINFLISISTQPIFFRFNIWAILMEILLNVILGIIGFYVFRLTNRLKHGF